jgi:hypothetical protein
MALLQFSRGFSLERIKLMPRQPTAALMMEVAASETKKVRAVSRRHRMVESEWET